MVSLTGVKGGSLAPLAKRVTGKNRKLGKGLQSDGFTAELSAVPELVPLLAHEASVLL